MIKDQVNAITLNASLSTSTTNEHFEQEINLIRNDAKSILFGSIYGRYSICKHLKEAEKCDDKSCIVELIHDQ